MTEYHRIFVSEKNLTTNPEIMAPYLNNNYRNAADHFGEVKTHHIVIDNNSLHFRCERCEGEYLDTTVEINNTFFCVITWNDRQRFILDFEEFLSKHRI
jgi:hypothetical protein